MQTFTFLCNILQPVIGFMFYLSKYKLYHDKFVSASVRSLNQLFQVNLLPYLQGTEILHASISDHDQQTINENEEQDDQSENG
ncbi:unnamed protein product [Rotaria sordida]|uniref:Uncharacterized protein n=1 Tax=Rotaria sordida TaxID=392033 RepID=A0A819VR90_9BILA|nr:unnamed protein product [Rotaria sordida]CAF3681767.1 unnamed protein product [Rotaria sordida]CAF4113075.1 unnamed protein product [Rotaria sordida]